MTTPQTPENGPQSERPETPELGKERPGVWRRTRTAIDTAINRAVARIVEGKHWDAPEPTEAQRHDLAIDWRILCSRSRVLPVPPIERDTGRTVIAAGYNEEGPCLYVSDIAYLLPRRSRHYLLAHAAARFLTGRTNPDPIGGWAWRGRIAIAVAAFAALVAATAYVRDDLTTLGITRLAAAVAVGYRIGSRSAVRDWTHDRLEALDQVAERIGHQVLTLGVAQDLDGNPTTGPIDPDEPHAPSWAHRAEVAQQVRDADTNLAIAQHRQDSEDTQDSEDSGTAGTDGRTPRQRSRVETAEDSAAVFGLGQDTQDTQDSSGQVTGQVTGQVSPRRVRLGGVS